MFPKTPIPIRYDKSDVTKFERAASVDRYGESIVSVKLLLDPKRMRPHHLPSNNIEDIKGLPKKTSGRKLMVVLVSKPQYQLLYVGISLLSMKISRHGRVYLTRYTVPHHLSPDAMISSGPSSPPNSFSL